MLGIVKADVLILRGFGWWRKLIGGKSARVKQTTFCYCPTCRHELCSDPDAFVYDKEWVRYKCPKCGTYSDWHFDAPVPLLLLSFGGHKEHVARRLADGWYALHFCQQCRQEWNQGEKP